MIGQTNLYRLGAVGDRTAADGDDDIGVGGAGLLGGGNHRLARRMRRHRVEGPGATRPKRLADFLDLVGRRGSAFR